MKTLILICSVVITSLVIQAQNEVDALRYSQLYHGGSARNISMGGAFGALGGDPSVLSYNPAGLGVYRKSEFTFTPSFYLNEASSNFMGKTSIDHKYNFNFNNMALIASANSGDDDGWVSVNFGFGYNRLNNFHRYILIQGQNNESSMTDYFAEMANGNTINNLNSFNEWLAWESYLIDPMNNSETQYQSALLTKGVHQTKTISQTGNMGEYAFSMAGNYNNSLYIGATIGIQSLRFKESAIYSEDDRDSLIFDFNSMDYKQSLETRGAGFNFKFGLIYRPVDWVRIGGAIHTPTFFNLTDDYSSSMRSNFESPDSIRGDGEWVDSPSGKYNYSLTTPFRAIGSLAFVIKKAAIISVDYEFVDYSMSRLRATDYSFLTENNTIQNNYTYAGNIRAGLEYRFGPFAVRGGYAMYQSPYNSAEVDNDGMLSAISGGFGIRDKDFFFDIAYVYTMMNENYYLYSPNVVTISPASIDYTSSQIMATVGIKF
ncbi:MAG: hypothetical protein ABIJ97_17845 [Bacteroidota bacterium]